MLHPKKCSKTHNASKVAGKILKIALGREEFMTRVSIVVAGHWLISCGI